MDIPILHQLDYDMIAEAIRTYGVVFIDNFYTETECEHLMQETLSCFENLGSGIDQHKITETWKSYNLPPQTRSGLFQNYMGHIPPVWQVRKNKLYEKLFQELYYRLGVISDPNDELLVSIDGINVKPNIPPYQKTTTKDWAHVDQTKSNQVYECIQSSLSLTYTSAGFRCSPKSHLLYNKIIDHDNTSNWYKFTEEDIKKIKPQVEAIGGQWQIICPSVKGRLTLWLSTLIHSAAFQSIDDKDKQWHHPYDGWRCVYYLCFRPLQEFTENQIKKYRKYIENKRCMNHWSRKVFPKDHSMLENLIIILLYGK